MMTSVTCPENDCHWHSSGRNCKKSTIKLKLSENGPICQDYLQTECVCTNCGKRYPLATDCICGNRTFNVEFVKIKT